MCSRKGCPCPLRFAQERKRCSGFGVEEEEGDENRGVKGDIEKENRNPSENIDDGVESHRVRVRVRPSEINWSLAASASQCGCIGAGAGRGSHTHTPKQAGQQSV